MSEITQEMVRRLFNYDPLTGRLTWATAPSNRHRRFVGLDAQSKDKDGYLKVNVGGRTYRVHRLVWMHQFGRWPIDQIDHINHDPADNRLENLREADTYQNMHNKRRAKNNRSGIVGVSWDTRVGKWTAHATIKKKSYNFGRFDSIEEASEVRRRAVAYRGEFNPR